MTLYVGRHLHSDSGSIVEVLQHVLAVRVFDGQTVGFLQVEAAGAAVGVVMRGTFSPACGNNEYEQLTRLRSLYYSFTFFSDDP